MRNFVILLSITGLAFVFTGCAVFSPGMTKDELLSNIRKQVDPDFKLKTAKTKVLIGKVDRGTKLAPARMIIKVKHPDKWRMMAIVPKEGIFIRAYDGKTAWEFSTKSGYKELTGKQFDELRLQADLAIYRGNYSHIFKTIEFDGEEKVSGELCYKIVAQPKDIYNSQPITFYVHKTTFLPYMMKETYNSSKGTFPVTTVYSDYKKHRGVMVAMSRIFDIDNKLIDVTVQSVEWNEYIDDSDFAPPEQF
jgi:outer membrane lipoprotein-sorting protein